MATSHLISNSANSSMTDSANQSANTTSGDTRSKLLRSVLRENAIFSLLTGGFLVIAGAAIDNWIGLNQWILILGGLSLIGYGAMVWVGAGSVKTLALTGRTAIAGDLGWVIGAVALVAATDVLTSNGEIVLLAISVPVLLFAIGQAIGLRRISA